MNWLLTIVFYFFLFFQYYISGDFMLSVFKYEKTFGKIFISGFLTTFLITFIVGCPCQLLFTSFKTYFIIQCIVFILFDAFLLFKYKDKIKLYIKNKEYKNIDIKTFLKDNWLCILFVVLFTSFSMANQLPIYQMNYDDMYYIGKVENLKTAEQLLDTNFFNGKLLDKLYIRLDRHFNTYELSYAFFSTIFGIKTTFFCRATMVLHNYVLFAVITKELSKFIVEKKYSQYSILPFFIFLIPFGFLQNGLPLWLRINSYDLWQFQTAAFYGSSVVRMMSIPILYIFSEPLLRKMELKKIIYLFFISLTLLSFSTIYVQVLIVFFIVILLLKLFILLYNSIKNRDLRKSLLYAVILFVYILLLVASKLMDHLDFIATDSFIGTYNSFVPYLTAWYDYDIILKFGIIFAFIGIFFVDKTFKKYLYGICLGLFLLINNGLFLELLVVSSFNVFFVITRTISSIQYLIVTLCGCTLINIIKKIDLSDVFINLIDLGFIVVILVAFALGRDIFVKYNYIGSGISKDGWNFKRVLEISNNMTAEIFDNVGNYFNSLNIDSKLYCPAIFLTDGIEAYDYCFLMSTSRVQIQEDDAFDSLTDEDIQYLDNYSKNGDGDINTVLSILDKESIDYIMIFNQKVLSDFESEQIVVSDEDNINPYYLIKVD